MTIDIKNLTFGYDGTDELLFNDVSLRIDTDWKLGLVGRNGRGKTTFFKLLKGELHGNGTITGSPEFVSFPFEISDPYLLGGDVIREIAPNAEDWQIRREMNFLELDNDILYQPYCLLSGGEKTKLQLISLFLDEYRFPLIDEPTNHLDEHGRKITAAYLKRKNGFILVSHDRTFLDEATDHTMAINKTNIEVSATNFSTWWDEMKRREKFEESQNERLKKEISRLRKSEEAAERWSEASERKKIGFDPTKVEKSISRRSYEGAKAAKMMRHAKNMENRFEKKIDEKSSLLKNQERKETLLIEGKKHHSDLLIKATNVVLFYDGEAICNPVNFEIHQGKKIAISGVNGCGKSTFLKMLGDLNSDNFSYTGEIIKAPNLEYSYVHQDTSSLTGSLRDYAFEVGADYTQFITILRKMGFGKDKLEQDISTYSEGQKKIVLIAGSLCCQAHIFIWDEPMNYIDIYIRESLEELLANSDITLICVEHDRSFKDKVTTSECEIFRN